MRSHHLLGAICLLLAGCDNAGENLGLPPLREGGVAIGVILDRDGSLNPSPGDTIYTGARVALFNAGGTDTVATAITDESGNALFLNLPIGRYTFAVVPGSLGDSLPMISGDTVDLRITANPDSLAASAIVTVGYQQLDVAEARTAPSGRRVFVRGRITSALQYFADSSSFLTGAGANIRVTSSEHRPGRTGNNPGDSVLVLGVIGTEDGQPVLRDGWIHTISEQTVPVPEVIELADVSTARGGELDAALVRIVDATIADTATVGEDFHVELEFEGATALAVFDSELETPTEGFDPGLQISMNGMLVPDGSGEWFIKPRPVSNEITIGEYPELSLNQIRSAAVGQKVQVRGIVTAGLQSFSDGAMFVTNDGEYLRITDAEHIPGRTGNNPGDSVLVVGTIGVNRGERVLLNGSVRSLAVRPAPAPIDVLIGQIPGADDGALDAALVRLEEAEIDAAAVVGGDLHVTVSVGVSTALVVIDSELDANPAAFAPGRSIVVRGVLVPDGQGEWFIRPRPVSGEIVLD